MDDSNRMDVGWSDDDSQIFIEFGDYFVPERAAQFAVISSLIPSRDPPVHIMDIGCGAGSLALVLLESIPQSIVHGVDCSQIMLCRAKELLIRFGARFDAQFHDLRERSWRAPACSVHAIVSSLALHHLEHDEKQKLYADLYATLEPDGVLIISDLIEPVTNAARTLAAAEWDEAVRERSLSLHGSLEPFERFQETQWNIYRYPDAADKPAPLSSHFTWLQEAGFADADLFWFKAGHAVFSARKE